MAVSNQVVTTTNRALVQGLADNVLGSNIGLTRVLAAAKKWKSGRQFRFICQGMSQKY